MRTWRLAASSLLVASAATACGLIVGIGDETFTAPNDAGSEAASDAPTPPTVGCDAASVPTRPTAPDQGGDLRVFAFTTASIGADPDGGPRKGYDLDNVCTCDPADRSRERGGSSCVPRDGSPVTCDDEAGIDDAIGHLFDQVGDLDPQALVEDFRGEVQCGHVGVLLVVTGYSGLADDPEVGVTILPSPGIQEPPLFIDSGTDAGCLGADAGVPYYMPLGSTADRWSVLEGGLLDNGQPDPNDVLAGWVKNYQLVVDARDGGGGTFIRFPLGGIPLVVHAPILTARVVGVLDDGGIADADAPGVKHFALREGVATGRVAATDFLATLETIPVRLSGAGNFTTICNNTEQLLFVKKTLCPALDIRSSPSDDGTGMTCDALSLVVTFEAAAGSIGDPGVVTSDAACAGPLNTSCEGF
ncbi:MAG TPA: hypothetical protein VIF62_37440 [Labilithrix sp.]|jgi:hypothetical protein